MEQSSSSSALRHRPLLARCRRPWTGWIQIVAAAFMILSPLPSSWASNWSDTDSDGYNDKWTGPEADLGITLAELNAYNSDVDNDGASNNEEAIEGSNPYVYDTDYDGISDGDELHIVKPLIGASLTSWDTDNDGYSDYDEWYNCYVVTYPGGQLPSFQNASYSDYDGDGMKNPVDPYPTDPYNGNYDGDSDGIPDATDPFPTDAYNFSSINNTTWYGDVLGDADSDGIVNWQDSDPYGIPTPPGDVDYDGVPDSSDPYPSDPHNYSIVNGIYWYGATVLGDVDGDGIVNWQDSDPYNAPPPIPQSDNDADGIPDDQDPAPYDAGNTSPINGIQWNGYAINDDDSDGFSNFRDPYPSDANNYSQVNSTTWQNAVLSDDDADTVLNYLDPFPSDATNFSSINGLAWYNNVLGDGDSDGIANWQDSEPSGPMGPPPPGDTDGDGFTDDIDPFPTDYSNFSTTNGIGWGANVLGDDDQDGTPNHSDTFPYPDSDSDGYVNHLDPYPQDPTNYSSLNNTAWYSTALEDPDGDTHPNHNDPYPTDHNNVSAFNGYSWPWSTVFGDDDSDGILNWLDLYPFDPNNIPPDVDGDGLTAAQEASYGTSDEDVDCDDDGLTDYEELIIYSTNPLNAYFLSQALGWGDLYKDFQLAESTDTDSDGIPDRIEDFYGMLSNDPTDAAGDLDANGMTNLAQYQAGLALDADLNRYDQDGDGMTDVFEDYYGLNKNSFADAMADADNDGVLNFEEAKLLLSPVDADTRDQGGLGDLAVLMTAMRYPNGDAPTNPDDDDNDGIPNWMESYLLGTSPVFTRAAPTDLDGDGLPDVWEHTYGRWKFPLNGLFVRHDDADEDPDDDSLTNFQEFQVGFNPLIADTDGNGIPDGGTDSDGDGLGDVLEGILGTNPNNKDSDGDTWDDDEEVQLGSSPINLNSRPVLEPMSSYVEIQTRWVNANCVEEADYWNWATWRWTWNGGSPPGGFWDFRVERTDVEAYSHGQAAFSDGRPPLEMESISQAKATLNRITEITKWSDDGLMSVSSAYAPITSDIIPDYPPGWDGIEPAYPDTLFYSWNGPGREFRDWHGAKLQVRLAWKKGAPKVGRLEAVTKGFIKIRKESNEEDKFTVHSLTIQPGQSHSSDVIELSADATEEGTIIYETLKKIEIVQPALDETADFLNNPESEEVQKDENGDDILVASPEVRFCRWREAFAAGFFKNQFHKTDRDRFHVKIDDLLPNGTIIRLKASNVGDSVIGGQYVERNEDGSIEVAMHQKNGRTISDPILLVSDGDDDTTFNGSGQENGVDDATLYAAFRSTISVEFPGLDGGGTADFKAVSPKGRIRLTMAYCGLQNAFVNGGQAPQIDNVTLDLMKLQALKAKEAYRQLGIDVQITAIRPIVLPATAAELQAQGANGDRNFGADLSDKFLDDIESNAIYNYLYWRRNKEGIQDILVCFIDSTLYSGGTFTSGFVLDFSPVSLISLRNLSRDRHFVAAHEVGHVVTKQDHSQDFPAERLLSREMPNYNHNHLDSKRLSWDEEKKIRILKHFYVPNY